MALNAAQSVLTTGTTPAPFTPTASDTISGSADIVPGGGCVLRVVTTGTATNVTIVDPGLTPLGNPVPTPAVVACPATGVRYILVSPQAVNSAGVATVLFSGALTGVTYDLIKF